ncbi:hypothetical protein RN001_000539 [Aquatica leii]|uniref:Olfactomedin-like domain-containing protein n=1 Tax=Aquatica leii TaxID=1421715 RepID=A0AAN7QM31_9COLE|nr:hypothetical protein RN001_000539 [Aquatica leii]
MQIETKTLLLLLSCVFCATALLTIQILLNVYTYRLIKHDLHKEFLHDVQTEIFKQEFRTLLQDNEDILYQVLTKLEWSKIYDLLINRSDVKRLRKRSQRISLNLQDFIHLAKPTQPPPGLEHPGPPGPQGPPGPPGSPGQVGAAGPPGPSGPTGSPGPAGPPGLIGPPGSKGTAGPKGENGLPGKGLPGSNGTKGEAGLPGRKGDSGSPGKPGLQGLKGDSGTNGSPGLPGDKGNKGDRGLPGQAGIDGLHGAKGEKGDSGQPGMKGAQGQAGRPGFPCYCNTNNDNASYPNAILIKKLRNTTYTGFSTKTNDHILTSIINPQFFGSADNNYTSWMIDPKPLNQIELKKIWTTNEDNFKLVEFDDTSSLLKNNPSKTYELDVGFHGNANAIYKGIFYYKTFRNKPIIIKYDFRNRKTQSIDLNTIIRKNVLLYKSGMNYFDFSVDENGLWILFSIPDSDHVGVIKIDDDTMVIQDIFEISIKSKEYIDMFMASGALYTIEYSPLGEIIISKAINLLSNKVSYLNLKGILRSAGISMITFNHQHKVLLTVDNGMRILYNLTWSIDDILPTDVLPE